MSYFLPKRTILLQYHFIRLFLEDKITEEIFLENLEAFRRELIRKGITEQEFNYLKRIVFKNSGANPSRERLDWYHSTFEVNGKMVENIGVYHHPITLREYGKELGEAIQRASVVVLEDAPTALGQYSETYINQMLEDAKMRGIKLSREAVTNQLNNQSGFHFFRVLEEIAAIEGKLIAVVDPNAPDRTDEKESVGGERVRHTNDVIELTRLGIFLAGVAGIVGPKIKEAFSYKKDNETKQNESKGGIIRRTFLKRMVQGIGVVALTPMIIKFLNGGDRATGIIRKAAYDYYDFRDVTSTKGLMMLAVKNLGAGPILLIYASPHSRAIEYYSSRPQLTETKYKLYNPLRDAQQPHLRLYRFGNNSWQLVEKEEIKIV